MTILIKGESVETMKISFSTLHLIGWNTLIAKFPVTVEINSRKLSIDPGTIFHVAE